MNEKTCKKIKKTLEFENSEEIFSLEIALENISPELDKKTIMSFLDTIYERLKDEIKI